MIFQLGSREQERENTVWEWAAKEFATTNEPSWLANLFLFTALPETMDAITPRQLFLAPVWYTPSDDENPVSLLGE